MLKGINLIVILLMIIMAVTVNLGVISRYVLDVSISWTGELSAYTLIWITFLGSAYATFNKTHLRFEGIVEKLPDWLNLTVKIFFTLLSIAFFVVVIYYGIQLTFNSMSNLALTLPISKGIIYAIIPISCLIIVSGLIIELLEHVSKGEKNI